MREIEYFGLLREFVEGKDVLDIGSINHDFDRRTRSKPWVFDFLLETARSVRGIDLAAREVRKARAAGYDIVHADAERYVDETTRYDVVFAGDLIEHLSNPGLFLACAHRNLRDDGSLILVTPNTYGLRELWYVVSGRTNDPPVHGQHTCYFTPTTLAGLAARQGFAVSRIAYVNIDYRGQGRWPSFLLAVNRFATRAAPRFRQTIVMEFRKTASSAGPAGREPARSAAPAAGPAG